MQAAFAGWDHALSREAMGQLELIDLLLMRWQKTFKPHARPWDASVLKARAQRLDNDALRRKLRPHLYQ